MRSLQSLSQQGVLTPVESLAKAGLISSAITSYKISRLSDGLNDGEITFGALDTTKFDSPTLTTFDNVASGTAAGFWEGAMDAITVNGTDTGLTGRTAILDTGTTLILIASGESLLQHIRTSDPYLTDMRHRCPCRVPERHGCSR